MIDLKFVISSDALTQNKLFHLTFGQEKFGGRQVAASPGNQN
jgi:hypothetical protein